MCTVAKNDKYNSYELKFDGKPSQEIRDLLKASGYRWNKAKGIWYGYADISAKLNAEQTEQPTEQKTDGKAEQRADREEQAKLLAEYLELRWEVLYRYFRASQEREKGFKTWNGKKAKKRF